MLLSEPLPLRTTTVWDAFAEPVPLPHRYGACSGGLIPYNAERTLWLWADHASVSVDDVTIDGVPVGDWQWRNDQDATGHAVTLVQFGQAPDSGSAILASGRGKVHARTGAQLTNPADIAWDILANIAGLPFDAQRFDAFRAECASAALIASGSIEAADSVQTVVRGLCASVGAIFCADADAVCRLWPGAAPSDARVTVDYRHTLSASSQLTDLCNDLTVQFAYADGQATASIQLDVPGSIAAIGKRSETLAAPWIADGRVAYDVAARLLRHRARPRWVTTAKGIREHVGVTDAVALDHPRLPVGGSYRVLSRERDLDAGLSSITFEVPVGDEPAIRLVRQSLAFAAQAYASVAIETVGTERVLTLLEEDGSPIVGASVTLDGATTRTTDNGGRVSFPASLMPVGNHTLLILTTDGRTLTQTVLVQ